MTTESPYLTVTEAAEYLRMKPDYVVRMFAKKRIRAVKLGTKWRTTQEWLDTFMATTSGPAVARPRKRAS